MMKLATVHVFLTDDGEVSARVTSESDRKVNVLFDPARGVPYAQVIIRIALKAGETTGGSVKITRPD